jgi:SAM-dependent methyltransferase
MPNLTSKNERIAKWNERFSRGEELHEFLPSPPLPDAVAGIAPGLALDIACGAGRNSVFLAERGWRVVAVDGSQVGINRMLELAAKRGCADRIEAHVVDLEAQPSEFPIEPGRYDLITDFYFLHRPLFAEIRAGVRAGGLFVAAIHVPAAPDRGQGGRAHHFLLDPGELERLVSGWGWHVLYAREGESTETGHNHDTAEIIAQRPISERPVSRR